MARRRQQTLISNSIPFAETYSNWKRRVGHSVGVVTGMDWSEAIHHYAVVTVIVVVGISVLSALGTVD